MQFKDDCERLIAEQAVLAYRAVNAAADAAEFGHGMSAMEGEALEASRAMGRSLIEAASRRRAADEKRSGRRASAAGEAGG